MVQEQADGVETIVGIVTDPQFGPVLMFGLGGVFVEAMKDVTFRPVPIEATDAKDMMEELKGRDALNKPRRGPVDLAALEGLLFRISALAAVRREVREMDLNPLFVSSGGVRICDARIMLA